LIKANFVSHLKWWFFFLGSFGQIIGGLGLPATPETVLVGELQLRRTLNRDQHSS